MREEGRVRSFSGVAVVFRSFIRMRFFGCGFARRCERSGARGGAVVGEEFLAGVVGRGSLLGDTSNGTTAALLCGAAGVVLQEGPPPQLVSRCAVSSSTGAFEKL